MAAFTKAVLFDLDGTLLNSLDDLADSANFALAQAGMPRRTTEEIRGFVGNGVRLLIERAVLPGTGEAEIAAVLARFRAHYAANLRNKTRPYPGIEPLLDALCARQIGLGVVSNKFDAAVGPLVAYFFGSRIAVAVGEGNGIPKKPAPDGAQRALSLLGADPARTLYVGDSDVDILTGHNAGLFSVGCTWGFRSRAVLAAAGADAIIDRPDELLALADAR
ncbi:MAG: HAD-IA family hydrolase [Oscillospiraceae bacterium]